MLAIVGTVGILGFATTIGLLGFWNRMPWVNVVHAVLVAGTMGSAILITGAAGNVALSVTVGVGEGAFAAGFNSAIALMAGLAMTLTCAWQLQAQRQ
jgi:predicted phage tail protein